MPRDDLAQWSSLLRPHRALAAFFALQAPAAGAAPADLPVAVSPGNATEFAGSPSTCPAFSWTLLSGAREYDLVVVEIPEEPQESRLQRRFEVPDDRKAVVLRQPIPGGASHWQPSTSRCFSPARRYAWSVRARHDTGWDPWSEPLLEAESAALAGASVRSSQ